MLKARRAEATSDETRRKYFSGEMSAEDYVKHVLSTNEAQKERLKIMKKVDRLIGHERTT